MKKSFSRHFYTLIPFGLLFLGGCQRYTQADNRPVLSRINIIDRDGMTNTIQAPERLRNYQNTDFLAPQAYEKVMGIYQREPSGTVRSFITSYYPNGQVHQYLDILNGRAYGLYREWHENGALKLHAQVVGGEADITQEAMRSYLFEGKCQAWNTQGTLEAEFTYKTSKLEGEALEYHANGAIRRRQHFHENLLEGSEETFDSQGTLLERAQYAEGLHHGITLRYWPSGAIMAEEHFDKDCLYQGHYNNKKGECVSVIDKGAGFRIVFDAQRIRTREEYKNGFPQGLVEIFDTSGCLTQSYTQKNGKRNGEECFYYPPASMQALRSGQFQKKISIMWIDDQIQGIVKTWYDNGQIESQREMSQNMRNGIASAWYRKGGLMLMEEYENDRLIKGQYFRPNERFPVSVINEGSGEATLYDGDGHLIRKIEYFHSHPVS